MIIIKFDVLIFLVELDEKKKKKTKNIIRNAINFV
jgi:hypothetical protein